MTKYLRILIIMACLVFLPTVCYGKEMNFQGSVPIDKEWNIRFTKEADKQYIKNNIYITNDSGETVTNDVYIDKDNAVVKIKAPAGYYKSDSNYTLHILSDVVSIDGQKLKQPVNFHFKTAEQPKDMDMNVNKHFLSSYNKENNYEVNIINGEINIKGSTYKRYNSLRVILSKENDGSNPPIIYDWIPVNDGKFEKTFTEEISDGTYRLQLDGKQEDVLGTGNDMIGFVKLKKEYNGELNVMLSEVCKDNYDIYTKHINDHDKIYSSSNCVIQSNDERIISLANEITYGAKDDYEKLLRVHDWVVSNIAYDGEGLASGNTGLTDAIHVLEDKKTVCGGYANITAALLRASGIETRIADGATLGYWSQGNSWDGADKTQINHIWNEAFVNGRWVILDTTWDAGYVGSNYSFERYVNHKYFDPSIENFSTNHLIVEYY